MFSIHYLVRYRKRAAVHLHCHTHWSSRKFESKNLSIHLHLLPSYIFSLREGIKCWDLLLQHSWCYPLVILIFCSAANSNLQKVDFIVFFSIFLIFQVMVLHISMLFMRTYRTMQKLWYWKLLLLYTNNMTWFGNIGRSPVSHPISSTDRRVLMEDEDRFLNLSLPWCLSFIHVLEVIIIQCLKLHT